jgi:rhodanese-related sulfurtransferase
LKQVTTGSTPQQVWERLLRNEPLFILDVRNRDEFERWRVEGPRSVTMLNVPYFELLDLEGEEEDVTEAVMRGVRAQLMEQLKTEPLIVIELKQQFLDAAHAILAAQHVARGMPAQLHAGAVEPVGGFGRIAENPIGQRQDEGRTMRVHGIPVKDSSAFRLAPFTGRLEPR